MREIAWTQVRAYQELPFARWLERHAIIPAAVGVDIGRGMMAAKTTLKAKDLPDTLFEEGARHFSDYVRAQSWAQSFAALNREVMMVHVIDAAKAVIRRNFQGHIEAVNCHHDCVQQEHHFGECVYVTRKGALRVGAGQLGMIPGSMGARSDFVRCKGNALSFESCSRGAGHVQRHRRRDANAARRGRGDAHAQAGGVCDGLEHGSRRPAPVASRRQ